MVVYSDTGRGHKSTADALAESINSLEGDHVSIHVTHLDIYKLAKVFLFRRAGRHYEILCRHARWLYDILFRLTDNRIVKIFFTHAIVRVYGRRLTRLMTQADPDVIIIVHPLFVADVLCELREQSRAKWRIVSFVTDLGIAHAGWASRALDSVFLVSPGQARKLRSQECLPEGRAALVKAPVRRAFMEYNRSTDGKIIESLGLSRPYTLYIPGLQPDRAIFRQVKHLTDDYSEMRIAVVGSISSSLINRFKDINPTFIYLSDLSAFEMAAAFRNADIISGKTGPAIMAEAASVDAHFVPTAEVGRQEAGNVTAGRALYNIDAAPWWVEKYGSKSRTAKHITASEQYPIMDEAEVRLLISHLAWQSQHYRQP